MQKLDKKRLSENINAFSQSTLVPVTIYSKDGAILEEFLPEKKFCNLFQVYRQPGECMKNLVFSAKLSYELGEPYIYSCPTGLINIAVPIIYDKKFCACAVAGPLALGAVGESHLDKIFELNTNAAAQVSKIVLFISQMMVYNPAQIQNFSTLLYSAILCCHKNWDEYDQINSRHQSQLLVGDSIRKYKLEKSPLAPFASTYKELEEQLIKEIRAKNRPGAESALKELFEEILLIEGGHFDNVKMRVFELYVSLSRMAIENGASLQKIFGIDFDLVNSLNNIRTVDDLFHWANDIITHFIDSVFSSIHIGHSAIITQAMDYLNDHYMNKITLRELSSYLHINESYLSKLFKQELGINFTDYLNEIRILHSVELIQDTDMNLLEVAVLVGFEDQSYFTKIFKKVMGETPKQYKKALVKSPL